MMTDKQELRKEARNRKRQFSGQQLRELSRPVIDMLLAYEEINRAKTVMLYCSLPDEVYTMDLIHELHKRGKRIVLPVVTGSTDMELRIYNGDDDLHIGSFNIMEPCGNVFSDYDRIDVIVAPGMGFDREGNRLGRGKGYYDRFLQKAGKALKIGICFPFQIFDRVPTDEHDIKMDRIICG